MTKEAPIGSKLDSLVLLRGIAVIAVCFCHLGGALSSSHPAGVYKAFDNYGKYGVEVFFVISGFVIPLSFNKGNYTIANYFKFLYKRIIRLHPPYLLALALTLVIMLASYKARHAIFPESVLSITGSIFYLHIPPDNPVFWTLAVEAQYYLFIGLFFVVINSYPKIAVLCFFPVLVFLGRLPGFNSSLSLFAYLPFFLIGIAGYMVYVAAGHKIVNYLALIFLVAATFWLYATAAATAGLFTIAVILFYRGGVSRYLQFFGTISYSIYLIHYPIGVKIVNILKNKLSTDYYAAIFLIVLCLIILLSWLFCRIIENPSERFSRKIKYKNQSPNLYQPAELVKAGGKKG